MIVTHNMQQAARVADMTAFFSVEVREDGSGRHGILVEYEPDDEDLHEPVRQAHRGLRHGALRMTWPASSTRRASTRSRRASRSRARSSCARCAAPSTRCRPQDVELCDEVIAFDDEIDVRYHRIERSIEEILAQQSPVATDLRLVLAVLHNSIHLERIGDQSVTVAKLTKLSAELETRHDLIEGLREMGERAEEMVADRARLVRATRDVERARELVELDELIDRTNRRVADQVLQMAARPGQQEWGMRMIVVARCIERIGDNAVDIGEQTAVRRHRRVRRSSPMPPTDAPLVHPDRNSAQAYPRRPTRSRVSGARGRSTRSDTCIATKERVELMKRVSCGGARARRPRRRHGGRHRARPQRRRTSQARIAHRAPARRSPSR